MPKTTGKRGVWVAVGVNVGSGVEVSVGVKVTVGGAKVAVDCTCCIDGLEPQAVKRAIQTITNIASCLFIESSFSYKPHFIVDISIQIFKTITILGFFSQSILD